MTVLKATHHHLTNKAVHENKGQDKKKTYGTMRGKGGPSMVELP